MLLSGPSPLLLLPGAARVALGTVFRRGYIKNFFEKPSMHPSMGGEVHRIKTPHFKYKNELSLEMHPYRRGGHSCNFRRIRKRSFESLMKYKTGRRMIMERILEDKYTLAEH